MVKVKICGVTNLKDAELALDLGAWALGFNFYPKSPRYITFPQAHDIISRLKTKAQMVGLFVNTPAAIVKTQTLALKLTMVQFHGNETPEYCSQFSSTNMIKAFRPESENDLAIIKSYFPLEYILIDSAGHGVLGGSGQTGDWSLAKKAKAFGSVVLAGGLTPQNVLQACIETEPFAVDVTSGVELKKGIKDTLKMKQFFEMVKQSGV